MSSIALCLVPGMQVNAEIHLDRRSLLEHFVIARAEGDARDGVQEVIDGKVPWPC